MSTLSLALSLLQADRRSEEGWRQLYLELRPLLVARFYRGGARQRADVEDLYQTTLLRLYEYGRFDQLQNDGELKAYASTIASRVLIDWQARVRKAAEEGLEEAGPAKAGSEFEETEEDWGTMLRTRDLPPEVLGMLSENDRKLIGLLAAGYTAEGIANELGLKPGSVRVRFHRLRKRLDELGR